MSKTMEFLTQDSRYSVWDSNRVPRALWRRSNVFDD